MLLHRQGATGYLHGGSGGDKQRAALEIIKDYPVEPLPCLCGAHDDLDILDMDRFGFPINYKLCKNCGLMRADPYFTEEALNKFYAGPYRDLDDQLGEVGDIWNHEWGQGQEVVKVFSNVFGGFRGKRVCEIGCGAGGFLSYVQEQGSEVLGIDSGPITDYAREKGIPIQEEWPTQPEFDMVFLLQVFEHFRDPVGAAEKIRTMLKDDGILVVNVPGIFLIPFPYKFDVQRYLILSHPWCYTRETLGSVMKGVGFAENVSTENVTAIYTKNEPKQPSASPGLYDDIVKFFLHQEKIFELFVKYNPGIFYAMKNTVLGEKMCKKMMGNE